VPRCRTDERSNEVHSGQRNQCAHQLRPGHFRGPPEGAGARKRIGVYTSTISELARDILFHANSGEITLKPLQQEQRVGIMVRAAYEDRPTIVRTASVAAQRDFTSSWSRLVLQRVRFVVDEMDFDSRSGEGATVTAIKWRHQRMASG
jgi:hypothetical protein